MKLPELLAPAGDFEKLRTAIHYGADAVYLGDSRFSLRGKAGNFGDHELGEAVAYAHDRGVRAYVTANILAHNRDIGLAKEHCAALRDLRPDAVIVSDPGLMELFRTHLPEIDIHISTQANITNVEAARFWERFGAKRLILSRELSIDEIREIRQGVDIEIETFVHGAICISYSGRCYISSFLTGRGANRGECTNSCRWSYTLMEEKRPGEHFPVFEDDRGTYVMSSRDLCMIEHLPLLAEAGVNSFKLEGRMKGINYVAGVTKVYREAIDAIGRGSRSVDDRWLRELAMFSSRGYTTGMFFGRQADADYNFDGEAYRMSHELLGIVLDVTDSVAKVGMRNRMDTGETVEYLSPGIEERQYAVDWLKDAELRDIQSARNEDVVYFPVPSEVRTGDLIRRQKQFRGPGASRVKPEA